jgi:acetyl esterase/lipase
MAPWLFLVASLIGALATVTALVPARHIWFLTIPYFFSAWLTGELALHQIAWQAIATVVFVACGALGAWPGILGLVITLCSWGGLIVCQRRAVASGEVFARALREGLGSDYWPETAPWPATAEFPLRPFKMRRPDVERVRNISYGPAGKRNFLDVYRNRSHPEHCPVLLQIHGGGWMIGQKDQQGLPLMYHLAARGWVCVAPNYRLSPRATFPDHLTDVKRVLAWIRQHGAEYGADPAFVVVTGGSAGGHLAAMVALTANDPKLQPGFEDVDTSVAGSVPFYGVYDFLDRHGVRGGQSMRPFLQKYVMKCSPDDQRERWQEASPIDRVHADAPPFMVLHGTNDSLAFVEDARLFVRALRGVSHNPVVYAEIPGAQHAFDIFHSVRCQYAVQAVTRFCECVRVRSGNLPKPTDIEAKKAD